MIDDVLESTSRVLKRRYLQNKHTFDEKSIALEKRNNDIFDQFMMKQGSRILQRELLAAESKFTGSFDSYVDSNVVIDYDQSAQQFSVHFAISDPSELDVNNFSEQSDYTDIQCFEGRKPLFLSKLISKGY